MGGAYDTEGVGAACGACVSTMLLLLLQLRPVVGVASGDYRLQCDTLLVGGEWRIEARGGSREGSIVVNSDVKGWGGYSAQ